VLVPPLPSPSSPVDVTEEQDGSETSPRKKSKPSPTPATAPAKHIIRPSRLVQPGGSGAFLLEATLATVDATLVQKMLQVAPQILLQLLSSKLQFTSCQIQEVLDDMFVVCLNNDDHQSPHQQQYPLLDEETILDYARQAVLGVLTEACADPKDGAAQVQECVPHIASRLETTTIPHNTAMARQVLEHFACGQYGNQFQYMAFGFPQGTNMRITNTTRIRTSRILLGDE
jgi:hypothetical protein